MNSVELKGCFLEDNGRKVPFELTISVPERAVGAGDYSCRLHAPHLFAQDKEIFGVTSEQAESLAIDFVRTLLDGRNLFDSEGNAIQL